MARSQNRYEYLNNHPSTYQYWPKTGAILWVGNLQNTVEESECYQFAYELLCEDSIRSGPLLKANSHPDFYRVEPLEKNHAIKIDQVRGLIDWVQAKPQIAARKVAFIYPAEAMNLQAANALLKTLEEVAVDTLFILVSIKPHTLPATILSRCHRVRSNSTGSSQNLCEVDIQVSLQEKVAQDLQLLALKQIEPVALAALWLKEDVDRLLFCLMVVLNGQICQLTQKWGREGNKSENKIENRVKAQSAFYFLDAVYETRRSLHEHSQLNTQLMLEALLIQYYTQT